MYIPIGFNVLFRLLTFYVYPLSFKMQKKCHAQILKGMYDMARN